MKSAMEQLNYSYYKSRVSFVNIGWRPTAEDTIPLIGLTDIGNLQVATGTKRDGFHCSPLIAKSLIDNIIGVLPSFDLSLFKPDRKPVKVMTIEESISNYAKHSMNANFQHDFVPPKNKLVEELYEMYSNDIRQLHFNLGIDSWGIPPEMVEMYRYGHVNPQDYR